MNNFSNFEGNANGRPAPPVSTAQQASVTQMNGLNGAGAATQWPNVGAQSDMNVLWEYIAKLSEMHEQIRQQTQQVASGMQQIGETRGGSGGAISSHVNGVSGSAETSAEIARLQHELASSNSKLEDAHSYNATLQALNVDFEGALAQMLDKLRPYAQNHAAVLNAQKAHYLHLLEVERSQNLELRLQQSRWQEKAAEVKNQLVKALVLQSESEAHFHRDIAGLKADNRTLRRLCGVMLGEEEEEREERRVVAKRGSLSPPAVRRENPTDGAQSVREIEKKMNTLWQEDV